MKIRVCVHTHVSKNSKIMTKIKSKNIFVLPILLLAFTSSKSQTKSNNRIQTKIEINQSHFKIDSDIKIIFTITNNSDKKYNFCYWQTPLEKSFTSSFFEITLEGRIIKYSGKMIKRVSPQKTDYLSLKPKQSISEKISLREGYDIDKKGKYKITFKGSRINGLQDSNQIEFIID